eukprot:423373_1
MLSHNNTHRSASIQQYFWTLNCSQPSYNLHPLDTIYTDAVRLNRQLSHTPRWISKRQLQGKYTDDSKNGIKYKKAIKTTIREIILLILTVSFVLFLTGYRRYISWTFEIIHYMIVNNTLNVESSNQNITITTRKQLKKKLNASLSNSMKSIEKLLFVKLTVSNSNNWKVFTGQQQNIIVAFTYIAAIQASQGVISDVRSVLELIKPQLKFINSSVIENTNANKTYSWLQKLESLNITPKELKFCTEACGIPLPQQKQAVLNTIEHFWKNKQSWLNFLSHCDTNEKTLKLIEVICYLRR